MGTCCRRPWAAEAKRQEQEAERAEAERLAKIPPIIVNVQCNGQPPTQVSVKPHEQVGSSMDRELKLSENDQRLKEVRMGDVPLDIKGCFEPQGVVDEANLSALTGPAVLRGHTGSVYALAVFPNGDIITGSYDETAIIWSAGGEHKRVLKGHTGAVNALAIHP